MVKLNKPLTLDQMRLAAQAIADEGLQTFANEDDTPIEVSAILNLRRSYISAAFNWMERMELGPNLDG